MVDVDVVETDGLVTHARLAGRRFADFNFFPAHRLRGHRSDEYEWQMAWRSPHLVRRQSSVAPAFWQAQKSHCWLPLDPCSNRCSTGLSTQSVGKQIPRCTSAADVARPWTTRRCAQAGVSRAYSSASHFMPPAPKLTCTRASGPEPSVDTMTPTPNLGHGARSGQCADRRRRPAGCQAAPARPAARAGRWPPG
jgi:hypothetical protein